MWVMKNTSMTTNKITIKFETLDEAYNFLKTGYVGFEFDNHNMAMPNTFGAVISFDMDNSNNSVMAFIQKFIHEGVAADSLTVNGENIDVCYLTEVGDTEATYDHHYANLAK